MSVRATAALAAAAVAVWLGSWTLLHQWFWGEHEIVDTPIYQQYADAMRAGWKDTFRGGERVFICPACSGK